MLSTTSALGRELGATLGSNYMLDSARSLISANSAHAVGLNPALRGSGYLDSLRSARSLQTLAGNLPSTTWQNAPTAAAAAAVLNRRRQATTLAQGANLSTSAQLAAAPFDTSIYGLAAGSGLSGINVNVNAVNNGDYANAARPRFGYPGSFHTY